MSVVLLCAAGSLLLWPRGRARPLGRGTGARVRGRVLAGVPLGAATAGAAALVAVCAGVLATPLVAVLAAGAVALGGRSLRRRRDGWLEERRLGALAEALGAFASDLRAGRPAEEAARAAVDACADEASARSLAVALRAPEAALDRPAGGGPWDDAVRRLAGAVRLSTRTGCSLAAVACAVEDDLRARLRHRAELAAAVAGPRASAVLLAGLPVIALFMGGGVGADPWRVLTTTPTGQLLLVLGVLLEFAGLAWSARLVRAALP